MKPKKLVMSAFGSYAGVAVIDFEKMEHGLFLIAGDTGSGKSTIFDAIMFALYDTMSGKERKGNMMRSEYAPESAETYVEYTFSYGSTDKYKTYTIKRYPSYERKSKRKNKNGEYGMTKQLGKVSLIMPDGKEFPGKAVETNQKIQEIIGLTPEQFSKIAMIAQGEFQELIMDKTGRRKEIFQQIFSTEIYEKIEKRIWERYKTSVAAIKENTTKLRETLGGVSVAEEEQEQWNEVMSFLETEPERMLVYLKEKVKGEAERSQRQGAELEKKQAELAKKKQEYQEAIRINKLLAEYQVAIEEREKLRGQQDSIRSMEKDFAAATAAKEILTVEQNYIRVCGEISEAECRKEEYKGAEKELKKKQQEAEAKKNEWKAGYDKRQPEILQQQSRLEEEKKSLQELLICREKLSEIVMSYQEKVGLLAKEEAELEKQTNLRQELEKWLKENDRLDVLYEQIQHRKEAIQADREELKCFQDKWTEGQTAKKELQQKEGKLLEAVKLWEEARHDYEEKNRAYIAAQSAFLAMELNEGEPCPVCGSRNHPNPAKPAKNTVTKGILDKARKREEECQKEKEICQLGFEAARAVLGELEKTLQTEGQKRFGSHSFEEIPKYLAEAEKKNQLSYQEAEKEWKRLSKLRKEKELKSKSLEQLSEDILESGQKLELYKGKLQELEGQKKALEAQEKLWTEKVTVASFEEATALLHSLSKEMQELQKEGKKVEKAALQRQKEYDTLLGNQSENESRLVQLLALQQESEEEYQEILSKKGYSEKDYKKALALVDGQEERQKQLENYRLKSAKCDERIQTLASQAEGCQRVEIGELEGQNKTLEAECESEKKRYETVSYQYQGNQRILKRVAELIKGKEDLSEDMRIIRSLNDVANGKIHFQTYILRQYFKKIIQAANKRLAKMTTNQFLLKCRELNGTGLGEAGLDLDVYNPMTGKSRDAHTLSGGETFLASLSMALGMADVVQNTVGKTHLDTMFIDEGFGSLSEEVRNTAVKVLLELAGDWRLVGVISHVTELKEQIPNKLIVTKGSHGSEVKWIQE